MFNKKLPSALTIIGSTALCGCFGLPVNAQIVPDTTLPSNSQVNSNSVVNLINGGTEVGKNLFHSFKNFSVLSGNTAEFLNKAQIENVITRITGNSISRIDGVLTTNANANLFILNPNGIIFGPNSQLNIGGSFIATTANSISFPDNKFFAVGDTQNLSLLSSLHPSELNFIDSPGPISVSGTGQNLRFLAPMLSSSSPIDDPIVLGNSLQTVSGKTFALIGGNVNIDGGILSAPSGNLVVSSVNSGTVGIEKTLSGFNFNYKTGTSFSDITVQNRSLLRATGFNSGDIQVQGNNLSLTNNSLILNSNYAAGDNGDIRINLSGDLMLKGSTNPAEFFSLFLNGFVSYGGIVSQNFSSGSSSDIDLNVKNLFVSNFGWILASNVANGIGGDIRILSEGEVSLDGTALLPGGLQPSFITTSTLGGNAGNITANGKSLVLTNSGALTSTSIAAPGDTGTITVDFQNITVSGGQAFSLGPGLPIGFNPTFIGTFATSQGSAKEIVIKARDLSILDGGRINSTVNGQGNTGDIFISVDRNLTIQGRIPGSVSPLDNSQIISSAEISTPFNRQFFGAPDFPTGKSGTVRVTAKSLLLADGGQLTARNDGPNDAGSIIVNAEQINIDNGLISATTASGEGGNINLSAKLIKATNGEISSSAMGEGTGGNITINADLVVAIDNSNFSANAVNAQGGNIRINTLGFFLSPDSQVTATSQLGEQFDGNVDIDAEITDFSQDPDLKVQVDPPELYSACSDTYRDTLAYYHVGTAGRPTSPITRTPADGGWLEAAKARYDQRRLTYTDPQTGERKPLKRVVGWKTNANGTITFVNNPIEADQYAPAIAARQKACQQDQVKAS